MNSGADVDRTDSTGQDLHVAERVRDVLVFVGGAAIMIGLVVAAMSMLTSPDSWVMKAANQAIFDQQQQAVATSYVMNRD